MEPHSSEFASRTTSPASALFEQQWRIYRKVVDNNLMYHQEVYRLLRRALLERERPFRFLDVACGDASSVVDALAGTLVGGYCGIDLSRQALDFAETALRGLPCPVRLECRDFVEALEHASDVVDFVWIGQSLHHLVGPAKLPVMRRIRELLGNDGSFMVWEPTLLDGEDRNAWLDHVSALRPSWAALSDDEFAAMDSHCRAADHPESSSQWRALGMAAGFSQAIELYRSPTSLTGVYLFA